MISSEIGNGYFEYWCEFLVDDHCGLCGNTGVIHVSSRTPANKLLHLTAYCICPNGRTLKTHGAPVSEFSVSTSTPGVCWRETLVERRR